MIDNSNLVINSGNQDAAELAEKIAKGYAWGKHVVKKGEFYGIVSDEREFKELIERIIKNPSETKQLANGRQGYWDDKTETLVITSPKDKDGGACFRPDNGKDYYDNSLE
ncbi:hypothetical protein [Desulfovibrio psychrotolerans]|uniref:Uncharacterized protein n=1 Tax=Desulfovibrio psychrotolerans TaxID=415242 RepID=A0A7J0BZB1_9BACT|nr:hypothetical protein [Desulfovibrio psychrotolerans]GFM38471.1 hypothetical protein DSM19430T_31550 [Desulfovibrio psychrotolerans]